jgi:pyruvate carboxylase
VITPYYDSLLVKVTVWGHSASEANARMDRALREFRIRGVSSNLAFLENVIAHPLFTAASAPPVSSTPRRSCFNLPRTATGQPGCSSSSATSPSTATRR